MSIYGECKTEAFFLGISCDLIFIPPTSCEKKASHQKELLLLSIYTRLTTDAPQSEGVVKTHSDAV